MMQAEQRLRYAGVLPEVPGTLPSEARNFISSYPMIVIDTRKFFDLLSHVYDSKIEKNIYEDLMLILENART